MKNSRKKLKNERKTIENLYLSVKKPVGAL